MARIGFFERIFKWRGKTGFLIEYQACWNFLRVMMPDFVLIGKELSPWIWTSE